MPSQSITHAIGTTTLLSIMILVGAAFAALGSQVRAEAIDSQLGDVAEYTASEMLSLVSLLNMTRDTTPIKELAIPASVGGQGYSIRLATQSGYWVVTARLDATPRIHRNATLPWKSLGQGSVTIVVSGSIPGGEAREFLYSGTLHPIVWGRQNLLGGVEVGLGVRG